MEKVCLLRFCIWFVCIHLSVLLGSAKDCAILPGDFVDCSHRFFNTIPNKTLPNTTRSLDLSHNHLLNISGYTFSFLIELIWLDLSSNTISKLDRHSFVNLSKLEYLNLNSNKLLLTSDTYPLKVFQPLVNLKIFHLEDNRCLKQTDHFKYPVAISKLTNLRELYTDFPPFVVFGKEFINMTKLEILSSSGFGIPNKRNNRCCVKRILYQTFIPFRNISIRHFRLADSCLYQINPFAFEPLKYMNSLELEGNQQLGLYKALQSFQGLQNRTITEVSLRASNSFIHKDKLDFLPNRHSVRFLQTVCVRSLKISENYLVMPLYFKLSRSDCLQELDMSVHSTDPHIIWKSIITEPAIPNINKLNISKYVGPPIVHRNTISQVSSNRSFLHLSRMDLSFIPKACTFHSEQFQTVGILNLSGWNCTIASPYLFLNMRNISELSMRQTYLDRGLKLNYSKGSIFRNMLRLERLDISDNQLTFIPDDMVLTNHKLKSLSLANNKLSYLPIQVLQNTAINHLDLSSNVIQWLTLEEIQSLETHRETHEQFKIMLNDNPFLCSCSSVHFLQWLNQTSIVADFGDTFMCRFVNRSQGRIVDFMEHFKDFSVSCVSSLWLTIAIIVVFLTMPLFICCIGYYRRRWNIHYWFYTNCKPTEDMLPERNYQYDAFVGYNHNDSAWVHHSLREALEAPERGMHLCMHQRDFEAGQVIQQNIVDSINNSRKVILVISHNFVQSTWGEYEIEMAGMRSVQEGRRDVIVCVLLEEVPIREMPRSLANLWQRVTFLEWPETLHDQDLFWDRLFNALQ